MLEGRFEMYFKKGRAERHIIGEGLPEASVVWVLFYFIVCVFSIQRGGRVGVEREKEAGREGKEGTERG